MLSRTASITLLVACTTLSACGRDAAPTAPAPSAAQRDQQAIAAATEHERSYQAALAKGDLAFLGECAPGAADSIRLVDVGADGQGYSLAVVPDARGAVAIWQGVQHAGGGKYTAYGPRGMRVDVNGWRQMREALTEPWFVMDSDRVPEPSRLIRSVPPTFIAYCLDGSAYLAVPPPPTADERFAFERAAVTMRRLAGNYYSPPAQADQ